MTAAAEENTAGTPAPRRPASICLDPGTRDVKRLLARTVNDLRNGRIDAKEASTTAYVASVLLKAVEIDVIDKRIAALEERTVGKGAIR